MFWLPYLPPTQVDLSRSRGNSTSTRGKLKHQFNATRIAFLVSTSLPSYRLSSLPACPCSWPERPLALHLFQLRVQVQLNSNSDASRERSGLDTTFNHSDILFCFVQRNILLYRISSSRYSSPLVRLHLGQALPDFAQSPQHPTSTIHRYHPPSTGTIPHPPSNTHHPPSTIQHSPSTIQPSPHTTRSLPSTLNPQPPSCIPTADGLKGSVEIGVGIGVGVGGCASGGGVGLGGEHSF
ncbi:hypothetical protein C8R47DRAFT_724372 [Mycena vitilis]|nr:hypothetical protein C8R47DRAFT_724372 [Mycena vitilis]